MSLAPPLILTNPVLHHQWYTHAEKAVLAMTLGHSEHNPSVDFLAENLGLRKTTVIEAQRGLEEKAVRIGENGRSLGIHRLAIYNRPAKWYDRLPDHPSFRYPSRLLVKRLPAWANPWYEHPQHGRYPQAELPGEIVHRLPKPGKNNALIALVALDYVGAQLRAGAIQEPDDALGYKLNATARQIERARKALRAAGIIVHVRDAGPAPIYVMPGGTPGKPENPDALDPKQTRRLISVPIGLTRLDLYASANEAAEIARLTDRLSPTVALIAIHRAVEPNNAERYHAAPILDALTTASDRWGELKMSLGRTQNVVRENGYLLPTSYSHSSAPAEENAPASGSHDEKNGSAESDSAPHDAEDRAPVEAVADARFARSTEGRSDALAELPKLRAALVAAEGFDRPQWARRDATALLRDWRRANDGEPLTGEQREILDNAVAEKIATAPIKNRGYLRTVIQNFTPTEQDALWTQLRGLRPTFDGLDDLGSVLQGIGD